MPIRAVVFDLDGVLVDSTPCHAAAFVEVLAPLGIGDFDYSLHAGRRTGEVIEHELRRAGMAPEPDLIASLAARKTLLARERLASANPVKPGCPEILERLAQRGFALALASSGSRGTVQTFLDTNNCGRYFRSVLTGADVIHAKPDPEIYTKSFIALKLPPDACMVIEDAVSGVESAIRAGAPVIGITGTCTPGVLLAAGAGREVASLLEIPDLLPET